MTGWEKYREPIARAIREHEYGCAAEDCDWAGKHYYHANHLTDAVIAVLPPLPEDSQPDAVDRVTVDEAGRHTLHMRSGKTHRAPEHRPGPSDDGVSYCEVCDYCWPCPTVAPTPSRPRRSGSGTP